MRQRIFSIIVLGGVLSSPALATAPLQDEATRFEALVARYYRADLDASPTLRTEVTSTRSESAWTPLTDEYRAQRAMLSRQRLREISGIDRRALPEAQRLRYDILASTLRGDLLQARVSLNSYGDSGNVYEALSYLPELLMRNQKIVDETDALNYISRLRALAPVLLDAVAAGDERHRRGIVMMKHLYPKLAAKAAGFAQGAPCTEGTGEHPLAADFAAKLGASNVAPAARSALLSAAHAALVQSLCPAYASIAQHIAAMEPQGRINGLWALPGGREAYRDSVALALEERVDPERVHRIGLNEVQRLQSEIAGLARQLGIAPDAASIATYLTSTPALSVANTDEGYAEFAARAESDIAFISQRLPDYFEHIPSTPLVIQRALTSPTGTSYYVPALMDGSKPAVYFLAFAPGPARYSLATMRTLTFHEAIPGHHLQVATGHEVAADMESLQARQYACFTEGWALYAEQLAYEMGAYEQDPAFILAWRRLQLERAARLVLDTGLNYKRWTPARAEKYQVATLGGTPNINRFLEMPGQALGYTWGFLKIMSAREEAKERLGSRFDIRGFHSVLLNRGPLPPAVMERQVETWIDRERTLSARDLPGEAIAAREEGLKSTIAWSVLESLTTEVGPRPVGTPAMDRARDWALAKLKALGFVNVRLETFTTPAWTRVGTDTAEVLSPYPQPLSIVALGGSSSTAPHGLEAEIALFRSYQEFLDQPPGSLRGKIAVVTQVMARTQDFSAYSDLRAQRTQGAAEAAKRGAIGYMMRSLSTGNTRLPHAGTGADAHIPSVALSGPDADLLERMVARGQPVRVRVNVRSAVNASATAYNISGEIAGTSGEVVIIGGHLDSWDQGTGALDDGAGIAIAIAAAKAATAGVEQPRRTIRVVLWGSEEQGGSSEAYFAAHEHELDKIVVVGESDDGADGIYTAALPARADGHPAMKAFRLATAPLRVVNDHGAARYGGEDVAGLVRAGVPTVSFRQSVERYMDIHHSADDTLDKVDPQKMAQSVATWAAFLRMVAHSDIDFRAL